MFKKVAMLVGLIVLSVPLFVGEGFIEYDWDDDPPVIAYIPGSPEGNIYGCSGYPMPEDKPVRCDNNVQVKVSYLTEADDCGRPCGGDPEPVIEYPEDKLYGGGKVAHPVDITSCSIPCGGDPIPLT